MLISVKSPLFSDTETEIEDEALEGETEPVLLGVNVPEKPDLLSREQEQALA